MMSSYPERDITENLKSTCDLETSVNLKRKSYYSMGAPWSDEPTEAKRKYVTERGQHGYYKQSPQTYHDYGRHDETWRGHNTPKPSHAHRGVVLQSEVHRHHSDGMRPNPHSLRNTSLRKRSSPPSFSRVGALAEEQFMRVPSSWTGTNVQDPSWHGWMNRRLRTYEEPANSRHQLHTKNGAPRFMMRTDESFANCREGLEQSCQSFPYESSMQLNARQTGLNYFSSNTMSARRDKHHASPRSHAPTQHIGYSNNEPDPLVVINAIADSLVKSMQKIYRDQEAMRKELIHTGIESAKAIGAISPHYDLSARSLEILKQTDFLPSQPWQQKPPAPDNPSKQSLSPPLNLNLTAESRENIPVETIRKLEEYDEDSSPKHIVDENKIGNEEVPPQFESDTDEEEKIRISANQRKGNNRYSSKQKEKDLQEKERKMKEENDQLKVKNCALKLALQMRGNLDLTQTNLLI